MADQRYYWMNPKRHEFLNHIPFGEYGNDYGITSVLTPLSTGAVLALIGERWSGDPVFCLCNGWPHALSPHRLEKALERYDIDVSSNWLRDCTDITGIFVQARGHLHKEWHPSTRGPWFDWDEVPYSGPFDLVPSGRRYCINRTRREYVDLSHTTVTGICRRDGRVWLARADPIPSLFSPWYQSQTWRGRWCLDQVDVADEAPQDSYADVTKLACDEAMHADDIVWQELSPGEIAEDLEELYGIDIEYAKDGQLGEALANLSVRHGGGERTVLRSSLAIRPAGGAATSSAGLTAVQRLRIARRLSGGLTSGQMRVSVPEGAQWLGVIFLCGKSYAKEVFDEKRKPADALESLKPGTRLRLVWRIGEEDDYEYAWPEFVSEKGEPLPLVPPHGVPPDARGIQRCENVSRDGDELVCVVMRVCKADELDEENWYRVRRRYALDVAVFQVLDGEQ